VQLLVLGFRSPDFRGEIVEELGRLAESDTVRVIDALAIYKDRTGDIEVMHLSNLSREEAIRAGSKVAELIGIEIEGEGTPGGTMTAGTTEGDGWDVLEDIPMDSAAAVLLLEHRWAIPLRDSIARAGGFRLGDGFISPEDLVAIGLMPASEAEQLLKMERARAA
jgi:hypothetical protein